MSFLSWVEIKAFDVRVGDVKFQKAPKEGGIRQEVCRC